MRFLISREWTPLKGRLVYRSAEYSFDFDPEPRSEVVRRTGGEGVTSILIGTLQIEVAIKTGLALFVWGYHVHPSRWQRRSLPSISPQAGGIKVLLDEEPVAGVSLPLAEVGQWNTTYDPDTRWVCVTSDYADYPDEYVEFADNTVAGIAEGRLLSLWLRPLTDYES